MIKLHFEKLYSTERKQEHCQAAVPFSRGRFYDTEGFALLQGTYRRKGQFKVTSRWDDGSIRWLFIRFLADFPRNRPTDCYLVLPGEEEGQWQEQPGVKIQGRTVYTGKDLSFQLPENLTASQTGGLLEKVWFREKEVACSFPYPVLKTAEKGRSVSYTVYPGQWEVEEQGYDYPVQVERTRMYFDTREYDTFSLPAGDYDAVRVTIGQAQGRNWWCVMLPPLCAPSCEADFEQTAREGGLEPGEIRFMTKDGVQYAARFKIVEWWGELVHSLKG